MQKSFSFGPFSCDVAVTPRAALFDGLTDPAFTVADANTVGFCGDSGASLVLPIGESAKSWEQLHSALAAMLDADLTRDSQVVGIGGGVVCDLTACAASLYMRGCRLVLIPSTLLAMVDAAIGGKTGVNFGGYKNMIGTFYPAGEIRLCTSLLSTLSAREYMSGLAEVIKTALLGDPEMLVILEREREAVLRRDDALLSDLVWRCVEVKGALVEADLTEQGVRAHLNLGHTFAHALESVAGLGEWSHGEAVAWGMARAMELGVAAGITDAAYAARVRDVLLAYGYRLDPLPALATALAAAMRKDKKRRGSAVRFVLQETLAATLVTEVENELVERILTRSDA